MPTLYAAQCRTDCLLLFIISGCLGLDFYFSSDFAPYFDCDCDCDFHDRSYYSSDSFSCPALNAEDYTSLLSWAADCDSKTDPWSWSCSCFARNS